MQFGVSVGHITAIEYAQHAERLGFSHCWVTDSPLLRSNLFATLAAVALQTRSIRIGAGVAVCGMRLAPEAANGVATINALAPGRTFAIFGTGNTAMRMLGLRPTGAKGLREYVRVVRAMVRGEEVVYSLGADAHPVRFSALEQNYARLEPPPPIHIAANGPMGQAVAGELADGLCTSLPRGGTMSEVMANARRGAARAGRDLPEDFHTSALVNLLVLDPGEPLTAPRVLAELGPAVMTNFHYLYDWVRETGKSPPAYMQPVWDEYMAFRRARESGDAHLTMHSTHYVTLDPEEARFLTPEILRALCIVGEPDEVIERLRALQRDGLRQITFHPPFKRRFEVMERFARQVMERV